jgi:ABC-type dipeptide/oligopeptide/nickel transport system permease subunit
MNNKIIESPQSEPATELTQIRPKVNELRRFIRVFFGRPVVIIGFVLLLIFIICAAVPQWLTHYDPVKQTLSQTLLPPSSEHFLGTDALGRDLYTRIIYGARTAIIIAVSAIGFAVIVGTILGLIAGYIGGITNSIIMRFIDAMMAFPGILLALTIVSVLGGGMLTVIIALGVPSITGYARVVCAQAMSLRENDYVLAARTLGASKKRIMFLHILPNAVAPLIVMSTIAIGMTILAEAGLSYLGIGITEPTIAWGSLVNVGQRYLLNYPLLSIAPGTAIMLVVFGFNMVGDGLRDALDPRLRGTL